MTGLGHRLIVSLRQVGWARSFLSLLALFVALFIAHSSWRVPLLIDAEHALFDIRQVVTAPVVVDFFFSIHC